MRVLRTAASAPPGTHPQSTPLLQRPHAPAPAAASLILNQGNMLSLPVLTGDSLRALWVRSDQACRQLAELDAVAELVEALDAFPYPTRGEMAALALRCSLHPDQVRVWFMVQRLRHGLSWDSEDIREFRERRLLPGSAASRSGRTRGDDEVEEGGRDKRGEKASEGQGEEDRMSVAEKRREGGNGEGKTMAQERGGTSRKKLDTLERLMEEAEKSRKARYRHEKKTETAAKRKRKPPWVKDMDQLKLLRDMFMARSYPTSDDYDRLVSQMGVKRSCVANWFADLRFRIKHGCNPVWLTKHACHLVRRRIKYRHKMKALAKEKAMKGNQH